MRTGMEQCCWIANCSCMRIGRRTLSAVRRRACQRRGARRLRSRHWPSRCSHATRAHGVKAAWVTGDTVYGGDYKLRSWLEERLQPYVLAVPKNQRIGLTHRADEVVASWEASAWQRLSDPTKLAYYFVFAPESVTLEQVVRAAGSRGPGGRSH
jgi:hypothetical protein